MSGALTGGELRVSKEAGSVSTGSATLCLWGGWSGTLMCGVQEICLTDLPRATHQPDPGICS